MANKDQIQGEATNIKGKVREAVGNVTNDEKQIAKGKTEQVEGKAQKAVGQVADAVQTIGDKAKRTIQGVAEAVKESTDSKSPRR